MSLPISGTLLAAQQLTDATGLTTLGAKLLATVDATGAADFCAVYFDNVGGGGAAIAVDRATFCGKMAGDVAALSGPVAAASAVNGIVIV